MAKLVIFIYALIVLAGSLLPCCYDDHCQDNKETCSPFSVCCASGGYVQLSKPVVIYKPSIAVISHHEKSIPFFTSVYYADFFQPPRV